MLATLLTPAWAMAEPPVKEGRAEALPAGSVARALAPCAGGTVEQSRPCTNRPTGKAWLPTARTRLRACGTSRPGQNCGAWPGRSAGLRGRPDCLNFLSRSWNGGRVVAGRPAPGRGRSRRYRSDLGSRHREGSSPTARRHADYPRPVAVHRRRREAYCQRHGPEPLGLRPADIHFAAHAGNSDVGRPAVCIRRAFGSPGAPSRGQHCGFGDDDPHGPRSSWSSETVEPDDGGGTRLG